MTGPAPIPEDDLELSFEAVSFGTGEKESGESEVPAPPSFSSSSSSAVPSGAGTSASGEAAGPSRPHRRRHSAGGTRYLQPHQDGGGGGTGLAARPRSGRNTRHSISGSLMPNQAKRYDKDPLESSGDGSVAPGEIVPTALVVKNIAFSVKKDQFLSMMEAEGIPKPYAFNYHYDNGVFRGLAFANYTTPEETEAVVVRLNGMDLAGRKLRAELKRAPPGGQAEKDRRLSVRAAEFAAAAAVTAAAAAAGSEGSDSAEQHPPNVTQRRESKSGQHGRHQRTKSRSDQDPDWREKSRSDQDPDWRDSRGHHLPPSQAQFQHYHHIQPHQLQQPHHSQQNNQRDGEENSLALGGPATPLSDVPHSREGSAGSGRRRPSRQQGNAGGGEEEDELDLDDPEVRGYYETILTWKQDRPKSPVLDFPPSLTSGQRKILHRISAKLGLYHFSEGDGADRHIRIMRTRPRNDKAGKGTQRGSITIQGPRSARNGDAPKPTILCEGPTLSRSPGGSAMSRSPMNRPSFKNPDSAQATFGPVRQPRGPDMANNFSARRTRLLSDDAEAVASTGSTTSQLNPLATRFNLSPSSNPPSSGGSPLLHPCVIPSLSASHTRSPSATNTVPAATGGSFSQGVGGRGRRSLDASAPNFVPAS